MPNMYEVVRPIPGDGRTIQSGETVDVSEWRPENVRALVTRGHLRPCTGDAPEPEEPKNAIETGQTGEAPPSTVRRVRRLAGVVRE